MSKRHKGKFFEDIQVVDTANKGKSIAKTQDGMTIFLNEGVPGDVVNVKTYKKRKGYFEGTVTEIKQFSPHRTDPVCEHFGVCGGCKWQHTKYESQLEFKQKEVTQNLQRLGKVEVLETLPILRCESPYLYRNKMEFSFSANRWMTSEEISSGKEFNKNALGFHKPGMWDKIVDITNCHLQAEPSNAIRNEIRRYAIENDLSFFHPRNQSGFLRSLMIRTTSTGELMILLQVVEDRSELKLLMDHILNEFPKINSLLYVINSKANDTLYDQEIFVHAGKPFIEEEMEGLHFQIGAKTFYQTNSKQAFELYQIARSFADLQKEDVVYDLYTGIGTIAQFIASKVKKVIGIDVVPESIESAKINAKNNRINNVFFEAGDMKHLFTEEFVSRHGKANVIITDPPREGMHQDVVNQILNLGPQKIVYVSCNSATQARDLSLLSKMYIVSKSKAVDMFPQTHHVENVVLLTKR